MKDILKIMRFDYLMVRREALPMFLIVSTLSVVLALFFSPMIVINSSICVLGILLILYSAESRSDFNKLYGILPVGRKTIVRARMLLILLLCFLVEVIQIAGSELAAVCRFYRFLPNQNSEFMLMVKSAFENRDTVAFWPVLLFFLSSVILGYLELIKRVFKQENLLKAVIITVGILTVIFFTLLALSAHDVIPNLDTERLSMLFAQHWIPFCIGVNLLAVVICLIFSEFTAAKFEKQEL